MKKLLSKKWGSYVLTYVVWLCLLLLLILNSKTEAGQPYPFGAGIVVSIISAFVFSVPVWGIQAAFFFMKKRSSHSRKDIPEREAGKAEPTPQVEDTPNPFDEVQNVKMESVSDTTEAPPVSIASPLHEKPQQSEMEQERQCELQARREEVVRNRLAESSRQEAELKQRREAHRRERAEKVQGMDYSALLRDAIRFASEQMYITKEEMQDEYPGVDAGTKRKLLEDLYDLKAIQPRTQDGSWLSLIDPQRAQSLIWDLEKDQNDSSGGCDWPAVNIDAIEGHEFEHYCAELLEHNGFTEVEVTPASGDFGVDVLAKKEGITYAIQCKCYSDTVGNHAVQEALSGAQYYHRMVAVVMTNNYFTPAAIETAHRTNVLLWDRDTVLKMTEQIEKSH